MIIDKSMIIVIELDGWANPFEAVFFLKSLPLPNLVDIGNFQPGSMKVTSNTKLPRTHVTLKIKTNIEPKGNVMYRKLAYFKVSRLTFSKSCFITFLLLQKYFKKTKLSIILSIYFILSINLSFCSYL